MPGGSSGGGGSEGSKPFVWPRPGHYYSYEESMAEKRQMGLIPDKPIPGQSAVTVQITESGSFRPGRPMSVVIAEVKGRQAADRTLTKMSTPPPDHKQKPEISRAAAQQPSVPDGQPQKGDCSGPATQITMLTPADL